MHFKYIYTKIFYFKTTINSVVNYIKTHTHTHTYTRVYKTLIICV